MSMQVVTFENSKIVRVHVSSLTKPRLATLITVMSQNLLNSLEILYGKIALGQEDSFLLETARLTFASTFSLTHTSADSESSAKEGGRERERKKERENSGWRKV